MGRYFGLTNFTKRHRLTSNWKGNPPCRKELEKIAQILEWDLSKDEIFSSCYDTCYKWENGWDDITTNFEYPFPEDKNETPWKEYGVREDEDGNIFVNEDSFEPVFYC